MEKFRRKIEAWGYHALSSQITSIVGTESNSTTRRQPLEIPCSTLSCSANIQDIHDRLVNVTLLIGPTGKIIVDVKICILFITQDMQEGDMLCGRYGTRISKVQRQCRACNVNYDDLDNLTDPCRYTCD